MLEHCFCVCVRLSLILRRTAKILGRERALLELNGVGVGGLETGQQRRWSVSSNERYIPQEPSFVLEAGEKGKSVANQQRYCCPLLHSINLVGDTPLHMAARYGHAFIAKVLLEFGAEPSPQNKWELTPLLEAVRAGHVGVVQALLQYGAEPVGATCHDGGTALHIAAASAGFSKQVGVQLMHMLLQATPHGLLPRVARTRDSRGFTPVDIAKAHGGVEMLRVLMESCAPAPTPHRKPTDGLARASPRLSLNAEEARDKAFSQLWCPAGLGLLNSSKPRLRCAWPQPWPLATPSSPRISCACPGTMWLRVPVNCGWSAAANQSHIHLLGRSLLPGARAEVYPAAEHGRRSWRNCRR
eukprot:COSAG01_NODE_4201_length_5247_cov_4.674048_3_plen_356_part_00